MKMLGCEIEEICDAFAYSSCYAFQCNHCGWEGDNAELICDDFPKCPECNSSNMAFDEDEIVGQVEDWRKANTSPYENALDEFKAYREGLM